MNQAQVFIVNIPADVRNY